jgi:hypothetical protein
VSESGFVVTQDVAKNVTKSRTEAIEEILIHSPFLVILTYNFAVLAVALSSIIIVKLKAMFELPTIISANSC